MAIVTPTGVTGYSGFWNSVGPGSGPYALRYGRSSSLYRAAVDLNRRGNRKYRAQMRALNGVAPGATAVDSYTRVTASQTMNDPQLGGGLRPVQVVVNNTTTTTAMRDGINSTVYDRLIGTQAFPVDLSGNGGGGKLRR